MSPISRRSLIRGAAGLGGVVALGGLASCGGNDSLVGPHSSAVARAEAARRRGGGSVVSTRLATGPTTVDLGGLTVATWAFGNTVPGPLLRATAGDTLRVDVGNGRRSPRRPEAAAGRAALRRATLWP
jgi:FtsP/CotA-like multicopper oxidase with cupredoxin domain